MIAIIDYGAGNIQSVKNALDYLKVKNKITDNVEDILKADKVIFPGVGAFGDVMNALDEKGLTKPIRTAIQKKPYLGICLGLQVLFEESEESPDIKGLGIFKGKVKKFKSKTLKIPQIGWNSIKINKKNPILNKVNDNSYFYFVHSYYVDPKDKDIILTKTDYGEEFVSGIVKDNIIGIQFHPERSGEVGLQLLKNFVEF
jgi:imidazole glycerol phosphate synthase glutamine amidotransferase subunit